MPATSIALLLSSDMVDLLTIRRFAPLAFRLVARGSRGFRAAMRVQGRRRKGLCLQGGGTGLGTAAFGCGLSKPSACGRCVREAGGAPRRWGLPAFRARLACSKDRGMRLRPKSIGPFLNGGPGASKADFGEAPHRCRHGASRYPAALA